MSDSTPDPQAVAQQVGGIIRSIKGVDPAAVDTGGDIGTALGTAIGAATPLGPVVGGTIGRLGGQILGAIISAANAGFHYGPNAAAAEIAFENAGKKITEAVTAMPEPQRSQVSDAIYAAYIADLKTNGVYLATDGAGHTAFFSVPVILPSASAPGGHYLVVATYPALVSLAQGVANALNGFTAQSAPTEIASGGGGRLLWAIGAVAIGGGIWYAATRRT